MTKLVKIFTGLVAAIVLLTGCEEYATVPSAEVDKQVQQKITDKMVGKQATPTDIDEKLEYLD